MSQALLDQYYYGWESRSFNPELFTNDFSLTSTLGQTRGWEEFKKFYEELFSVSEWESIEYDEKFYDADRNVGIVWYHINTTRPFEGSTRCAALVRFDGDKISSVQQIFDATQWEKAMESKVHH